MAGEDGVEGEIGRYVKAQAKPWRRERMRGKTVREKLKGKK